MQMVKIKAFAKRIISMSITLILIGTVNFTQDTSSSAVHITGTITTFPTDDPIPYGFHIHELGTLDGNCTACSGHYNPTDGTHGGPWNATRHIGDLGNINATTDGKIDFSDFFDNGIQLTGPHSIIGRALVLHAGTDDYGLNGTNPDSAATGDAGARFGCGIIGVVSDFNQQGSSGKETLTNNFKILTWITFFVVVKNILI